MRGLLLLPVDQTDVTVDRISARLSHKRRTNREIECRQTIVHLQEEEIFLETSKSLRALNEM